MKKHHRETPYQLHTEIQTILKLMGGDRISPVVHLAPVVFPTCIKMLKTKCLMYTIQYSCCQLHRQLNVASGKICLYINPPEVVNAVCTRHLTNMCRLKLLEPGSQTLHSFCVYSRLHKVGVKPVFRPGSVYIHTVQL